MKKEGLHIRNLNSDILPRHKGRTASVTDKLHFHFHTLTVPYRPSTPSNPTVAEHQWNFPRSVRGTPHSCTISSPSNIHYPITHHQNHIVNLSNQENEILLPHREKG
jgi:hypothetical protein